MAVAIRSVALPASLRKEQVLFSGSVATHSGAAVRLEGGSRVASSQRARRTSAIRAARSQAPSGDGGSAKEGAQWKHDAAKLAKNSARFVVATSASVAVALSAGLGIAEARPEGVNKPELLPAEFTTVIDVAGFLSQGQEQRLAKDVERLEQDTGYKLRILAQNYPNTPGLAIRDYWGVDDETIVFVADPNMGNLLNFNVGSTVDLSVPRSFWSRLAGKYGNLFYWREKGEDVAIEAAVIAIDSCLREEPGPRQCSEIK